MQLVPLFVGKLCFSDCSFSALVQFLEGGEADLLGACNSRIINLLFPHSMWVRIKSQISLESKLETSTDMCVVCTILLQKLIQ